MNWNQPKHYFHTTYYSHKLYISSIICFQGHHYETQNSFETWRSWWIDFEIYRKSYRLFQKLMLWNFITNFYAVIFLRIMNIRHFYGNWQIEFCKEIWLLRRLINGLTSKYLFSNFKDFKQFIWLCKKYEIMTWINAFVNWK